MAMRLQSFFPAAVMFWFLNEAAALGAKSILQPRSSNTVEIPFYTLVSIKHHYFTYFPLEGLMLTRRPS
jgi:hypothetical protein